MSYNTFYYVDTLGTKLFTVVCLPNETGKFPTVILRSPYVEYAKTSTDAEAVSEFVMDNALGIIGMSVFSLFVFASMICAVVLPIVFRKKLDLPRGSDELPRGRVFNTVIVNAGVITMLAVYLFEFGLNLLPF